LIWGRWEEPNRRVKAIDPDGQTSRRWITSAPGNSDAALRERLERKGYSDIQISHYDFQEWKETAQLGLQKAIDAIQAKIKPDFDEDIYGALKQHLFDLSDGRCAYCEAKVQHVDYGDVEHYRPKKGVTEDPAHPGYYWLAYEPANLLPSCGLCNKAPGKLNQFPVVVGTRVADHTARLEGERPLLINPYQEDPLRHLHFFPTGDVDGKSEQGRRTIAICRLHRLSEERRGHMERLATDLQIRRIAKGDFESACQSLLEDLLAGHHEYCNALLDHLLYLIDEEEKRVARVRKAARAALGTDP
jgi:hypothetical protein